jgi:hypothetical protein
VPFACCRKDRKSPMIKENILTEIILRDSPFAWWEWNVRDNKVSFNDLKATMLGYSVDAFHDKGYEAFTKLLHPDDYEKTMTAMRDLLTGRKNIYQIDYRIKDIRNTYHWYMDRGVVTSFIDDTIFRIRGIVLDLGLENQIDSRIDLVVKLLHQYSGNQDQLLTICSGCKRVKINSQEWTPLTTNFSLAITDTLSHGICPSCVLKLYPEHAEKILSRMNYSK